MAMQQSLLRLLHRSRQGVRKKNLLPSGWRDLLGNNNCRHYEGEGGRSAQLQYSRIKAPVPPKRPFAKEAHGVKWCDPYHWMSDPSDRALLEHLQNENKYADEVMADTLQLQRELMKEMARRLGRELSTPPERWGNWWYYTKVPEGQEYPVYYRRRAEGAGIKAWTLHRHEEVLLDQNAVAKQFGTPLCLSCMNILLGYAHVGMCKLSGDHRLLAYTVDTKGSEEFTLYVKDLTTGQLLTQHTTEGVVSVEWARNEPSLFYTVMDHLMRPSKVFCRRLDSSTGNKLVLEDKDASMFVDVARTKDWRFITLNVNTKTTSEVYLVDAENPGGIPQRVEQRRSGIEYFVEHHCGFLYILTNSALCHNYRLVRCPVQTPTSKYWEEVVGVEDGVTIGDMDIFHKHLVLYQRRAGLPKLQVLDLPLSTCPDGTQKGQELALPQEVCNATPGANQDFFSSSLRLAVNSPTMPEAIFDYDLATGKALLLQQHQPLQPPALHSVSHSKPKTTSGYPISQGQAASFAHEELLDLSSLYVCEQVMVTSSDGVQIPLTLVYACDVVRNGSAPALLVGYGAYGQILETEWCSHRFSLIDRGWVLALAHVRGGGELGKAWHQAGRLMNKTNSFQDFLACAKYLVDHKFAQHDKLAAWGISAGGLLLGATINMCPNLFRTVILEVPFVDICNTMLDPSLPLTVPEYDEWGNPEDPGYFRYIRSYSPYDTVQKDSHYPAMLVTSSLHDTRVGYWEAAKWVAKIRDFSVEDKSRPVLLKTSMNTGHFGEGGRFQHLKTTALQYAFLIKTMKD